MNILGFTINVVEAVQGLSNPFTDFFFSFISFLGEQYIIIAVLGFLYWTYNKKFGETVAITIAVSGVFNNLIKVIVGAKRPFLEYPDRVDNLRPGTSTGNSFPSGHTQGFSTMLFSIAFYIKKLFIVSTLLVILMMLSRMFLGVHYLEDVIVGAALGIMVAYIIGHFINKFYDDKDKLFRFYNYLMIGFFPFVFLFKSDDLFKTYGMLIGLILAITFEYKFVNFDMNISRIKKLIRYFVGLIIMIVLQVGIKKIYSPFFEEGSDIYMYFDFVRYLLIAFVGFGLYPYIFKRLNF
ncbi:hypothetical protein CI105_03925 [Candidatus Izimaplasma bacterium ZiA1]|uniref:phosphatase PAP2 family protein n=1 Tax=Candidatus Izimoplasma sp. ZiA1 TaxID=2024899 RepID=UPI000BAA39E7|nr:hypothetical protein CI105_03925 [Candidatus Izimaplasma bacterium ZiA1]